MNKSPLPKKLKIKKGDTVEVISGASKGITGAALEVDNKRLRIKVKGVRMVSVSEPQTGNRMEREAFIDYSNVKLIQKAENTEKKKTSKKA